MKEPKKRIIFDNYDIWTDYALDIREERIAETGATLPDDELWEAAYASANIDYDNMMGEMSEYFGQADHIIVAGMTSRWDGKHSGFSVFDTFEEMWNWITKDCEYYKVWDENGHLYLQCSHHDGVNLVEIQMLNEKGKGILEDWEYDDLDHRSALEVKEQIWDDPECSNLPRYAEKWFGLEAEEWEEDTAA